MWARWPQESWFSTWLLPLPAGLGQQHHLCPAEATTISNELCFLTWEKGLGKEWRHWAFLFWMLFLHESHLVCLRHNPSCWVCNLPICVNLQVKKKGPSPAAAGSPDSLGGTFHLDVHVFGEMGKGHFLLGMQITSVHCKSAWPSYLLLPLFSCEFSKCKEPSFHLERLSMIHWKEKREVERTPLPPPLPLIS